MDVIGGEGHRRTTRARFMLVLQGRSGWRDYGTRNEMQWETSLQYCKEMVNWISDILGKLGH